MATLTQLLYSKVCEAPKGWLASKEGRKLTAKMIRAVRKQDGKMEGKHFRNLVTVATVTDKVCS